jgi:flagellar hook-associated protein 1
MINSFQPLNTITSGLILQQLEEEITANNIAQPSVDSQGYLMNSLEQVNSESNPSINISGPNGLLSIGTGASATSITSLRSSYLDSQIQQQSMVVGYDEVLTNTTSTGIMNQINSIVNGPISLSSVLSSFTAAWNTLAANPENVSDQTAVVNAGVTFSDTANSQYSQLQTLQLNSNTQIGQTVTQINGLLQQLGSINQQLLSTSGSNQNSLLDARDYALDRLSRLMNYQVSYGTDGTTNVWLGGVSLVSGANVNLLQENTEDPTNPALVDITVATYSSQVTGSPISTAYDLTSSITGGNLGGELYGRNVLLQNYKIQVDQIATSVMNITNNVYEAGYVANTANTGTAFFTGTGAGNIEINAVLANDAATATSPFLATEIQQTSTPAVPAAGPPYVTPLPSGALASILGNLGSLLASSSVQSNNPINKAGFTVNPTATIASQIVPAVPASYFNTIPNGGSFIINGVTISYTTANSINDILNKINSSVTGVYAVFNDTTQEFDMYSNGNITVTEVGADNFISWANVKSTLTSTITLNNSFAPTEPDIVSANALDSNVPAGFLGDTPLGPNTQAFFVTPSITGTFTVNGTQISWNDNEPLTSAPAANSLKTSIQAVLGIGSFNWNPVTQKLQLITGTAINLSPISIYDNSGNFTIFTGLNGNLSLSSLASNILSNSSTQNTLLTTSYTSASASLTQLNNEQDNLAGVATPSNTPGVTNPGVPIATIEQQAYQSMITYNAMLEVMEVIDQMLDALVGISSTTSTNGIFQQQTNG